MSGPQEVFIFTTCQVGAEKALKDEIARLHQDLKPAFSRPGFVTFKGSWTGNSQKLVAWDLSSVFARSHGLSLGQAKNIEELPSLVYASLSGFEKYKRLHLHVWERDRHKVGEEPLGWQRNLRVEEVRRSLMESGKFLQPTVAFQNGDLVLDVIDVDENLWWLGCHEHSSMHSPYAGGIPDLHLPEEAPSRAYLKLQEALLWSQLPIRKNDIALEIGSAPGGASYALLEKGLRVIGVDPAPMSEVVLKNKNFIHLPCSAAMVSFSDIQGTQWLLMDVNIDPKQALQWLDRIAERVSGTCLGAVVTIKLNHWKLADRIPMFLQQLKKMGLVEVQAKQLAFNKQEICVAGLTRKGSALLNKKL